MNIIITIEHGQIENYSDLTELTNQTVSNMSVASWLAGWIGQQAGEVTAQLFCPLPPDIEPSFPHKSPCPSLSTLEW